MTSEFTDKNREWLWEVLSLQFAAASLWSTLRRWLLMCYVDDTFMVWPHGAAGFLHVYQQFETQYPVYN